MSIEAASPGAASGGSDILIGSLVIAAALCVILIMCAWSRRTIERIAAKRLKSARDITRDLKNGGT